MSDELRKIILEAYLKHTEESTTAELWYHKIAKELGLDENKVQTECIYLENNGYLEKEKGRFPGDRILTTGVRITSKGKKALRTTYNSEWIKQNEKKEKEAKETESKKVSGTINKIKRIFGLKERDKI